LTVTNTESEAPPITPLHPREGTQVMLGTKKHGDLYSQALGKNAIKY